MVYTSMSQSKWLKPGDIIKRRIDDKIWVFIECKILNNDIALMKFFCPATQTFLDYTNPWGATVPLSTYEVI